MSTSKRGSGLLTIKLLYLVLAAFSFYLLALSRTGETRTVWQTLHPAFIPTLFVLTFVLLSILLTSDKTPQKLLLVIVHSILIHSLFSIIFPAGDLSGQQMVLGRTRRVFDNTILYGLSGLPTQTASVAFYEMFKGANLQAALSTVLARMLNVDIFYVHLSLVPVLWGLFVPIALFLITKTLCENEKASILSSLIVSAFPFTIYFGGISVPNSLGFIFFSYSLYFMLKYLASQNRRIAYFMLIFTFFSLLSHYLTGIMSLSLLILAIAFKVNRIDKTRSSMTAKISLIAAFLLCASLLPLSFTYLRLFDPSVTASFSLDRFYESQAGELVWLFIFGGAYDSGVESVLLLTLGPAIALFWMLLLLYRRRKRPVDGFRERLAFLSGAYLIVLVDYRVLKLFMSGLPINEERLWVLRDFMAAPFVALAISCLVLSIRTNLKAMSSLHVHLTSMKTISKRKRGQIAGLFSLLNALIPALLGGWITVSLKVAYPEIVPPTDASKPDYSLQITSYELEAARYLRANTQENYVVIGDLWAVYAGEMVVGIFNRQAFYFGELDKRREDLFQRMLNETSSQPMIDAMNQTGTETNLAYFIISKPRLGTEQYDQAIQQAQENGLQTYHVFYYPENVEKLRIFSYRKENA